MTSKMLKTRRVKVTVEVIVLVVDTHDVEAREHAINVVDNRLQGLARNAKSYRAILLTADNKEA